MADFDFTAFELAGRIAMMQPARVVDDLVDPHVPELAVEQAPAVEPPIYFSVGRTRDLLELEYHKRFVTAIRETSVAATAAAAEIIRQDPRRIRYELMIGNGAIAAVAVTIGSQIAAQANSGAMRINIGASASTLITRDFKTDGDSVCSAVWGFSASASVQFSVRETFLTPLPVDEETSG